ncbi:MAG: hypothetical protein LAP85_26250 [Acidobacteriia bacterium]|nr:hypothetical protein [Terriglobia bacterium]
MKGVNIEALYDSLQVRPDIRLQQRIMQRLLSIDFDGWAYILTHQFLTRRTCADELIEAIDQALLQMGPGFPVVGLLHGIAAQQVPPMLRVRPCLSVGDPDWRRQISEALKQRAPSTKKEVVRHDTRFMWRIHPCYGGDPSMTAIEVGARLDSIPYWRFAIPKSVHTARWGLGAAGGGDISPIKFAVTKGSGRYGSLDVVWFGAANAVSTTESAYVVFCGPLPDFVCFGPAVSPQGPPGHLEVLRPGRS